MSEKKARDQEEINKKKKQKTETISLDVNLKKNISQKNKKENKKGQMSLSTEAVKQQLSTSVIEPKVRAQQAFAHRERMEVVAPSTATTYVLKEQDAGKTFLVQTAGGAPTFTLPLRAKAKGVHYKFIIEDEDAATVLNSSDGTGSIRLYKLAGGITVWTATEVSTVTHAAGNGILEVYVGGGDQWIVIEHVVPDIA